MEKKKISIIVSAYNTEAYIEKCLNSLLQQTYRNIEILLIDDCSTDGTLKILKKFAKKDKRIVLLENNKNQGLAYSRNLGLRKASGDFIGFVDSDDVVDPNYYEAMANELITQEATVAVSDIKSIYEVDGSVYVGKGCEGDPSDTLSYINVGLAASACNKLFQREVFEHDPFHVGKINEDVAVVIPILIHAQKLVYVKDVYYYYIQRDHSIQNSDFSFKKFDIFTGVEHTLLKIKTHDRYEIYKNALVFNQIILMFFYQFPNISESQKRKKYLKEFYRLSFGYDVLNNPFLNSFFKELGKKTRCFYQLLLFLEFHKLFWGANMLINVYRVLKQKFQTVSLFSGDLDDLVLLAKKNQGLSVSGPTISVVVPNYNYARFMYQRIASILKQKVHIFELILLDDCSSDESREVIDEIVSRISPYISIKKIYNEVNSGSAFSQWEKGFQIAKGDYVWICEADDYCDDSALKEMIRPILHDSSIVISYVDTAMMDVQGRIFVSSLRSDIDLQKSGHWNHNYVMDGVEEFQKYTYLNCTIANVSSALFKNADYSAFFSKARNYKQAGDWIFYALVMQTGRIAYSKNSCNYYRQHGSNVTSVTKKQAHFEEVKQIHDYFISRYALNEGQKKKILERQAYLAQVWELES